ncbi:MAG: metabolite traffic protein EboE [Acidobacteria bacterium]|nr:metabolite traffic protein EboE [Acidobacteriota bacterium]
MRLAGSFHLAYCSNIHPGESWQEVSDTLAAFLPQVRRKLCHSGPFGVGLRLSARAAEQLERPANLAAFSDFLADQDCYVFTINGFAHGVFHGQPVKEAVYLPSWMDPARLRYTNRLARILAVLPGSAAVEASISTAPGAFRRAVRSDQDAREMARLMLAHVAELHRLREQTGRTLLLALEPEPCCYLETVDDAVAFFNERLFSRPGLQTLAGELGMTLPQAEEAARRHIGLCYDACHMAVAFEDPRASLARIKAAGIRIGKFQISSALKLRSVAGDGRVEKALRPFAESTYLHQVVEKSGKDLVRYADLPEALAAEAAAAGRPGDRRQTREWRVHFHVPIFLAEMKNFGTTQDHLISLIELLKQETPSSYLEVETYTWDVLPAEYKTLDTASAIARELAWVRDRFET